MTRQSINVARPTLANPTVTPVVAVGSSSSAPAEAATLTHTGLELTALEEGAAGNSISLTITQAATEAALSISVAGNDITVDLPADSDDAPVAVKASALATALNADTDVKALVAATGDDTDMTTKAKTSLSGGSDATYSGIKLVNPRNPRGLAVSLTNATGSAINVTVKEGAGALGANGVDATVVVAANSTAVLPRLDAGKYYDLNDGSVNMDYVGTLTIRAWSLR